MQTAQKKWHVPDRVHDDIFLQILHNRGIDPHDAETFIAPNWEEGTHSPFLFTRMHDAVQRLFTALERNERIVIHGDYDADGVSGSSLLYLALQEIAQALNMPLSLEVFLPDRERDGYGVALHTIDRLADEETKLLITVDCGIANIVELARAHERGMDVIVCDHHQLAETIPKHAVLLHPLVPGETYPNKKLCGTGVAFKFASALIAHAKERGARFPEGYEKWFLDFVAIATVTDVMPLTHENRVLEYFGLRVLKKTRREGLRALLAMCDVSGETLDTGAIGFRIGPRINAAGRMASARDAFVALTAQSPSAARDAVAVLEQRNRERQQAFAHTYEEALAAVAAQQDAPLLVVYAPHWQPGIIGLVAGRLQSDFGKPAFACTRVPAGIVGSGRSVGGLHLVELMQACTPELFVKRGGHPQACGLTLVDEHALETFIKEGTDFAHMYFGADGPRDMLRIDAWWDPSECTQEHVLRFAQCAPFGEGNPEPVFAVRDVEVVEVVRMGQTQSHARITVRGAESSKPITFVAFGWGDRAVQLRIGERISLAYTVAINTWQGKTSLQFRAVDIIKYEG